MSPRLDFAQTLEGNPLVILGCGSKKQSDPCPALDLYTGNYFRTYRKWAESVGAEIYIFSAKHGVIPSSQVIEPYNVSFMSEEFRNEWVDLYTVRSQLENLRSKSTGGALLTLAGENYRRRLRIAGTGIFTDSVNPVAVLSKRKYGDSRPGCQSIILKEFAGKPLPHVGENHV